MQQDQALSTHSQALIGSIKDIMTRENLALEDVLPRVKAVILYDHSSSMADTFQVGSERAVKHEQAFLALTELQRQYPGQILLIAFNNHATLCLDGIPPVPSGGTSLSPALSMAESVATWAKTIIISDGEAQDQSTVEMRLKQGWPSQIDTIFIGPRNSHGAQFLARIAQQHGGSANVIEEDIALLEHHVAGLLPPRSIEL